MRGLRDEVVLRLGLSGMRASEIWDLSRRNVAQLPTITWTGKGRKPRQITAGIALADTITRLLDTLPSTDPDTPIIWPMHNHIKNRDHKYRPTRRKTEGHDNIWLIVTTRADRAALGHVAPHDLRRTAASILHNAKADDGGHHFDLLDIQRVLGHSDPAVTMKCYIEPMNTATLDKAATFLD